MSERHARSARATKGAPWHISVRRAFGACVVVALTLAATTGLEPAGADANEAPGSPPAFRSIAIGNNHACAILINGSVKCWGDNTFGQLGQGDIAPRGDGPSEMGANLPPIDLGAGRTATALTAGDNFSCALLDNSAVKCWGINGSGQHGIGQSGLPRGDAPNEMGDNLTAADFNGLTPTMISAGNEFACARFSDGSVKCWGRNTAGQLGQGHVNTLGDQAGEMDALAAINLGAGRTATAVSAASTNACALLNGGDVKCWGSNGAGQLGQGDSTSRGDSGVAGHEMGDLLLPIALGTGRTATAIDVGEGHACALLDDNTVKCWGNQNTGELGTGGTNRRGDNATAGHEMGDLLPAVNLGAGRTATGVSAGRSHSCALLDNATIKCWGANTASGAVGTGVNTNYGTQASQMGDNLPAVSLGTGRTAAAVTTGDSNTCARLDDDSVKCWGLNSAGELGQGDTALRGNQPNQMGDNLPAVSLAAAPGAPTIGAVTPANRHMAVAFTPPADSGGGSISSYTVTASPGGAQASGPSSPITVTGLTNGTAYTFTVVATNVAGNGAPSAASPPKTSIFQPDDQARKNTAPAFSDVNAYGTAATVATGVKLLKSVTFVVKIESDANASDLINVKAALSGSTKMSVTFRQGPFVLSNMTTAGRNYLLAPHTSASITITITARSGTPKLANKVVTVTARSLSQLSKLDQVKVKAIRT